MSNDTIQQDRVKALEQQLRLSDEGVSRLAQRCLELEKKLEATLARKPEKEMYSDSSVLLQPLLYFDAGFGFSQRDVLQAKETRYDETDGTVTARFQLSVGAQALRFDPGELPCCVMGLAAEDERIRFCPNNGMELPSGSTIFLGSDPNYRLEGLTYYPAETEVAVAYRYYPLEAVEDEPVFHVLLETIQYLRKENEKAAQCAAEQNQLVAALNQTITGQQKAVEELQATVAQLNSIIDELRKENEKITAESHAYEAALDNVLASSSWKLTAPIRGLLGLFHRG